MRLWLVLFCLLALGRALARDEPVWDAMDRDLFERISAGRLGELSPAEQQRLRFWEFYYHHRAHLAKVQEGALLRDDFDAEALQPFVLADDSPLGAPRLAAPGNWRIWSTDSAIRVGLEGGSLVIAGRSSRDAAGPSFNGLVSRRFADTDVVLVVDLACSAPAPGPPGSALAMAHLCGSVPDLFNELRFGWSSDGSLGWSRYHRGTPGPDDSPLPRLPPFGDEGQRFRTLRLEHEAATEMSSSWILDEGRWIEIGSPRRLVMSTATVELKVNAPGPGESVRCRFDNCRLYGRPQTHAVRLLVSTSEGVGETDIHGVQISLFLEGGDEPLARGSTNELGWAALLLPAELIYPLAARMRFTLTSGEIWDQDIPCTGIDGLYPGDVWVAHLNVLDIAGKDRWWRVPRRRGWRPTASQDGER